MAKKKRKQTKKRVIHSAAVRERAKSLWIQGFGLRRIARLLDMPFIHTLGRWAKEEDWEGQLVEINKLARQKYIEKMADELSDEDMEQMRLLLKLSEHIESNLDGTEILDPQSLKLLATSLDLNVKGRRLIAGEVTERQEKTVNFSLEDIIYATAEDK